MTTPRQMIGKPFKVAGVQVTSRHIADAIDRIANLPSAFQASDLTTSLMPESSYHAGQEATNRLMQRWRKLGLVEFGKGRWKLTSGAWSKLQNAAADVRTGGQD